MTLTRKHKRSSHRHKSTHRHKRSSHRHKRSSHRHKSTHRHKSRRHRRNGGGRKKKTIKYKPHLATIREVDETDNEVIRSLYKGSELEYTPPLPIGKIPKDYIPPSVYNLENWRNRNKAAKKSAKSK